ncbi:hypothetical protein SAMN05216215_1013106 [Saccharopolyspora shandongensis]|uniref:Uncharacterized protein n=2 Tax=Saccharopolyspora shandongensis TaxID=418495 RepID=A0A1H3DGR9_9PSEU|nr:hypothetical protein SAMN05216215_1013106 [Saccharopolyspora shandongensis]
MPAVMQTAAILSADPNELVTSHQAQELLGVRKPVWREMVRNGDVAIFQPAAGPRAGLPVHAVASGLRAAPGSPRRGAAAQAFPRRAALQDGRLRTRKAGAQQPAPA